MSALPGFTWRRDGRDTMLLHSELADEVGSALLAVLDGSLRSSRMLAGGRGVAVTVRLNGGGEAVLRRNRRGGLPARFLDDLYVGFGRRPFAEIAATERLRRCGVLVPECLGAIVRRQGAVCYRGVVATRYVAHSANAWEALRNTPAIRERRALCAEIASAVERLHEAGATHPDLNLTNFLIEDAGSFRRVWILDCDRVRFSLVTPVQRFRAWRRLRRSAEKLDPGGSLVDPAWLSRPSPDPGN